MNRQITQKLLLISCMMICIVVAVGLMLGSANHHQHADITGSGENIRFVEPSVVVSAESLAVCRSLRFRNASNQQVVVKDLIASCGCTKIDMPIRTIKPGAFAEASFQVDLGLTGGERDISCLFKCDGGKQWSTSFTAIALPALQFQDANASVWMGGRGERYCKKLWMRSFRRRPDGI